MFMLIIDWGCKARKSAPVMSIKIFIYIYLYDISIFTCMVFEYLSIVYISEYLPIFTIKNFENLSIIFTDKTF